MTPTSKGDSFSKSRLEAFSDGVFAIAITLLILDVAVQESDSPWHAFLGGWPSYVGYVISFVTIGVAWIGHSAITEELTEVDAVFLRLNLLLLLFVVFLPFPTKLVTDAFAKPDDERVAVTVFGITLLLIRLQSVALDRYARAKHLYAFDGTDEELAEARGKTRSGLILYAVAIVAGLLLPRVAVALYFGIALYLAIPWRDVAALIGHRSRSSPE